MSVAAPLQADARTQQSAAPVWRRLRKSMPLKAKIGAVIFGIFILIAIIGPAVAPYDPSATTTQTQAIAPNIHHLLGTTSTGQDVLSSCSWGCAQRSYSAS